MVFDNLVFPYAHAGFFHSHFSQRNAQRTEFQCNSPENFVNLFLGISCKNLLSGAYFVDQFVNILLLVELRLGVNFLFSHIFLSPRVIYFTANHD